ncbi:hypothetical protein EDB81DRAFT_945133 [Dactylonectria macrodidyma]|uniref:Uncharacterized protein n=1 Tax=Dactylonectria macrodidyma TaxID=307937 RepID=A0A9P9FBA9_9HYPO|nr:hypothetical protein EDB81DRAFT_945133 [Dactylonectria macrodidyma]
MASLIKCPTEIIQEICRLLCPHCCNDEWDIDIGRNRPRTIDISRLSRTCKVLRLHALPILYHRPALECVSWLNLLRTLAEHRHLATHVREIMIDGYCGFASRKLPEQPDHDISSAPDSIAKYYGMQYGKSLSPEEVDLMVDLTRERLQGELKFPAEFLCKTWTSHSIFAAEKYGMITSLIPEVALSKIFITLLPNLVRLSVEISDTWDVADPFLQPGSLPCLTEIRLLQLDADKPVHIDAIKMILAAAPSLRIMSAESVTGASIDIQHETLVDLDITHGSMNRKSFEAMLRGCKRLKCFSYGSDPHRDGTTPRERCDALQQRATTLESLSTQHNFGSNSNGSLKKMQVLKNIHVSRWSSYNRNDNPAATTGTLFTDFLPHSVQSFRLDIWHDHFMLSVMRLAASAPTQFPDLMIVHIATLPLPSHPSIREAFKKVGVRTCLLQRERQSDYELWPILNQNWLW